MVGENGAAQLVAHHMPEVQALRMGTGRAREHAKAVVERTRAAEVVWTSASRRCNEVGLDVENCAAVARSTSAKCDHGHEANETEAAAERVRNDAEVQATTEEDCFVFAHTVRQDVAMDVAEEPVVLEEYRAADTDSRRTTRDMVDANKNFGQGSGRAAQELVLAVLGEA